MRRIAELVVCQDLEKVMFNLNVATLSPLNSPSTQPFPAPSKLRSTPMKRCLFSASIAVGVAISDLGQVQNMHVEVFKLPANTDFTLFVITTPKAPFVPAWYQGDLKTNASGDGVVDVTGIFSDETFILNPGPVPVEMDHLGMWFADAADAVNAGC